MGIPLGNRVVVFARVVSPVGGDRPNALIGRHLLQQLRQHWRITDVAGGDLDRPNLQCFFIDPYVYLAQIRRLGPPCLRAFHSPSPSALIPMLTIRRFKGPVPPRYGRFTFSVF